MEENGEPSTPFWLQTSNNLDRHRHRRSSSLLFNPTLLIVLLPTVAFLLLFVVVPSVLSYASQTLKSSSVKRNWDSLNLLLVLFAVACGFLKRRNDDGLALSSSSSSGLEEVNGVSAYMAEEVEENPVQSTTPRPQWFEYSSDPRIYDAVRTTTTNVGRLRRSCSSYPDLRQEFSWASGEDERWRFFDDNDIALNNYRSASEYIRRRRGLSESEPHLEIKTIPVDTFWLRPTKASSSSSPPPPVQPPVPVPPPPPPPPSWVIKPKTSRTFHSVKRKENVENPEEVVSEIMRRPPLQSSPPPPPPLPPPRPSSYHHQSEQKRGRSDKKRRSGAKDIAISLAFLYQHRKKKKKKNYKENQDIPNQSISHSGGEGAPPPPRRPPPPPPPLPPPASVFHNLFSYKKSSKSKRIYSISLSQLNPSPPPPPPPPRLESSTKRNTQSETPSVPPNPSSNPPRKSQAIYAGGGKPPLPVKANNMLYSEDENLNSGGQSPLIPKPPPCPPFQMPEMDFLVGGHFQNSCSSSPVDSPTVKESEFECESFLSMSTTSTTVNAAAVEMIEDGDGKRAVFCPSPDVNTKADTFIARFRAGLKLEKMNSIKEKQINQKPNVGN